MVMVVSLLECVGRRLKGCHLRVKSDTRSTRLVNIFLRPCICHFIMKVVVVVVLLLGLPVAGEMSWSNIPAAEITIRLHLVPALPVVLKTRTLCMV